MYENKCYLDLAQHLGMMDMGNNEWVSSEGTFKLTKYGFVKTEETNESELKQEFNLFRLMYIGTKRGLDVEWSNLKKKIKDYSKVVPHLRKVYAIELKYRELKKEEGSFVPEPASLSKYINQKYYTTDYRADVKRMMELKKPTKKSPTSKQIR